MKKKVEVGQTYNNLTVIKRVENYVTPSGISFSKWHCKCSCGNEVDVLGSSLTSGHTKSCGCLSKRYKVDDDVMLHKKFGMLIVVSRATSHKIPSGSVYDMWNCKCDCGNETVTFGRHLRTGKIVSCGCTRAYLQSVANKQPKAERWTMDYLKKCNITYEYQKSFATLVGQNGGLLSYDFFLLDKNMLLELHGLQHYKPVEWFGGCEGFEKQQIHDKLKREYADVHGYVLIEIPTNRISQSKLISTLKKYIV